MNIMKQDANTRQLNFTIRTASFIRCSVMKYLVILSLFLANSAVYAQNALQDITFASLPGNQVQLSFQFAEPPSQPLSFSIDNPARIALDFAGTNNELADRFREIGVGIAQSVNTAEASGRTRVVVNLTKLDKYTTSVSGNSFILTIGAESSDAPQVAADTTAEATHSTSLDRPTAFSIDNVDFRRAEGGVGRVVIELSSPNVPISMSEQGGRIIVDFSDTSVPSTLSKRWDVADFATPVNMFETFEDGANSKLIISPDTQKIFEHLAYQTDNQYIIEVSEVPEEEIELRRKDVFEGERLSLNFQDIEVRSVLQLIADFTSLNMVVSDAVGGNLTLRLKNVPWDQALDIILKTKGLGKRETGNVIYVAPSAEIAAREKLELESQQQVQELAPLRSEYIQVNFARASDIAGLLKSADNVLLSFRGNVTVDDRTNTLLVQDTALKLNEIRKLVNRLDIPVKQVLIESRIVSATDNFSKELGVRFGITNVNNTDLLNGGTADLTSGSLNATTQAINGETIEFDDRLNVNLPAADPAGQIGLALTKLPLGFLIELELSAAQVESRAEIISSPRVIASNQTTARIEQGTEIPFQSQTSSGATDVEFKKAVLSLEVTPQITPDNRVSMKLNINNDSVGEVFNQIPSIDTNEVETDVLVDNGQTIVLGGIYVQDSNNSVTRVPFFSDIPLVGRLFKTTLENDDKSELLVFITPKIIDEQLSLVR